MEKLLYGREPLLHALVPRLIGLAHDKRSLVRREHPDDLPAVLITGRHGTGRSTVLDELEGYYGDRLPLGRIDLAAWDAGSGSHRGTPGGTAGAGYALSNTSQVADILEQLVEGFARDLPGYGRIRFPRLLPGLFAVSSWHRGNGPEQELARERIAHLITVCSLERADGAVAAGDWTADVSARLADAGEQNDLQPVADAVTRQFFERYARGRGGRSVQDWYRNRYEGAADGTSALVRLSLRFHMGGDFQREVERVLVAAFLEDLAEAYRGWKRLNRVPRPLVLLDNVHAGQGSRILDLILEYRAELPAPPVRDPLVVVATLLGDPEQRYPHARTSQLPALLGPSGWSRGNRGTPSSGLLTVPLPQLTHQDLLQMLESVAAPLHPYLPTALHRLTRGNPLGARTLCEAVVHVAETDSGRTVRPGELLNLVTREERRPVTETLLEQLVPDPQMRGYLVLLSLARDADAAEALAERCAASVTEPFPASAVFRYLQEEQWDGGTGGAEDGTRAAHGTDRQDPADGPASFVAEPFLRALLVHEARRVSGTSGTPVSGTPVSGTSGGGAPASGAGGEPGRCWDELHGILRDHYRTRYPDPDGAEAATDPDVLRHTLAVGDADTVADELTRVFGDWPADRWLETAAHVATAPRPPLSEWADRREELARGADDLPSSGMSDLRRCVNRLLHGLWYLSEAVAEPLDDLSEDLGQELSFLSRLHPTGHAVLNHASRTWPAAAREQQPYPIERAR